MRQDAILSSLSKMRVAQSFATVRTENSFSIPPTDGSLPVPVRHKAPHAARILVRFGGSAATSGALAVAYTSLSLTNAIVVAT